MNLFGFTLPNFTSQAAAAYKANIDAAAAVLAGLAGNVLINGDGMINQRSSASGIADDTYDCDRWYTLTQTGTIAYSQQTDVADNVPFMMRMTQSQVTAQRMGRAQIVEGKNCKWLRGQQVTLALRHKISAAANIRMAILEWTGTEDAVTSDVVNSWTNSTYTAGNFFNSTTLTVSAVSGAISSTSSLAESTLTATLGSTFNNLIIILWTESTAAQNVTLDLAAQLTPGGAAGPWSKRSSKDELNLCRRYLPMFRAVVSPSAQPWFPGGMCYSTSAARIVVPFQVPTRIPVTSVNVGTIGNWKLLQNTLAGVAITGLTFSAAATSEHQAGFNATGASGLTAGDCTHLYTDNNAEYIWFGGAEL
jgi:hypothetical protein